MARILVTGGTGFVGEHFIRHCLSKGHQVVAVSRPGRIVERTLEPGLSWRNESLGSISDEVWDVVDCLVHLAAAGVSPKYETDAEIIRTNVCESASLLLCALNSNVRSILLIGTFAEYGKSFDAYREVPSSAPLLPTSLYPASKAAFYIIANSLASRFSRVITYARLGSVYGPGQKGNGLYPQLCKAAANGEDLALTDGRQIRDFVHVDEVVRLLLEEVEYLSTGIEANGIRVRHIGAGNPQSLREFCESQWMILNGKGQLNFGAIDYRTFEQLRCVMKAE